MMRLIRRLVAFLRPGHADAELAREMHAHLGLLEETFLRRGMSPDAARTAAVRALGGVQQTKDLQRDARSFVWLEELRGDVRLAGRALARSRAFSAVVVATLGLGIGAAATVFSVVNAVLLQPLPYRDADRLVRLMGSVAPSASATPAPTRTAVALSIGELLELKSRARTLEYVGTIAPSLLGFSGYEDAAQLQGAAVSQGVFETLGVQPIVGRAFVAADELPGAPPTIIVSAAVWRRYFGADPAIVGRTIATETVLGRRRQTAVTVIGVMPDRFDFPGPRTQFWVPVVADPAVGRGFRGPVLGRLADGVSIEAAAAEIAPLVRELRKGQRNADATVYELVREQDELVSPVKSGLVVLSAAVACVLLIACVNVANLVLARAHARSRDIAIRTVLGAGRRRIVRYLLTECVILALAGGVLGVVVAFGSVRLLRTLATTLTRIDLGTTREFPRLADVAIDLPVLMFSLAVALVTGILFGLVPAFQSSRTAHAAGLKDAADTHTTGAPTRLRHALLATEIALTMVLLVAGGLLIRSLVNLVAVDTGYRAASVLTFQVSVPLASYPDSPRLTVFAEQLVARLRAVPGVRVASYASQLPMVALRDSYGGLWRRPDASRGFHPDAADARLVSRDYFATMGIRVVSGRGFADGDGAGRPRVVVINERLARREFPQDNPLGQSVFVGRDVTPWEVIGVVRDVRQFGLDEAPEPQFFVDIRQAPATMNAFPVGAYYAVRLDGEAASAVPAIRSALRALEPAAALYNVAPMERIVGSRIARPRMYAVLVGVFATLGLVLALVGVYGLVGYVVTQRTREIGIRMSLGARRRDVLTLVTSQIAIVAAGGIVAGLAGAAAVTRYLATLLFELRPLDPFTFIAGAALFALVAAASALIPARRAVRIDPLVALRYD
jgi:predicted permease